MTNRLVRLSAIVFAVAFFVSPGLAQNEPRYPELPNFHKVDDTLFRGGQPRKGGMKRLSALGIKTVINLRGTDDRTRAEGVEAAREGLQYFNISMPELNRPSDEQVARVLAIINDPANQPVFIHCKRGSDRTGTIVACYRISKENWTDEQAIAEARRHGMSWIQFSMKDYISDFDRNGGLPKRGTHAFKERGRFCIPCLVVSAVDLLRSPF
jgi:protein tyrosine/serine phosphatase